MHTQAMQEIDALFMKLVNPEPTKFWVLFNDKKEAIVSENSTNCPDHTPAGCRWVCVNDII